LNPFTPCESYIESLKQYVKASASRSIDIKPFLHELDKLFSNFSFNLLEDSLKKVQENFSENKIANVVVETATSIRDVLEKMIPTDSTLLIHLGFELNEVNLFELLSERSQKILLTDPHLQLVYDESKELNTQKKIISEIENSDKKAEIEQTHIERIKKEALNAEIGISSADVIAADMGSLFIVAKNAIESIPCTTPRKHIVIVGIEKIVDDFFKASNFAFMQVRLWGKQFKGRVHIISNPSRTGDIEKIVVYGAHGPRELYVTLIDNGRLALLKRKDFQNPASYFATKILHIVKPHLGIMSSCLGVNTLDPLHMHILVDTITDIDSLKQIGILSQIAVRALYKEKTETFEEAIKLYEGVVEHTVSKGVSKDLISEEAQKLYDKILGEV